MKFNYLRTAAEHHLDSVACRRHLPQKKSHGSFLQSFLLLAALLLAGVGVSWGQTSYGKAEISSAPTSATDWQCITDQGNVKAWYKGTSGTEGENGGVQIDNKWFVKLSGDGFIKIRVAKGAVSAGDILKVEVAKFYGTEGDANLGFKVEGSNSIVQQSVSDRNIYTLSHTLKAGDINNDPEDTSFDFIQINRNGQYGFSGCAYHSVEILRQARYTVTWNNSDIPSGCDAWFTIESDDNQYKATKTDVPAGTKVTFHGTDTGNERKMILGWINPDGEYWGYGATREVTVNSNISVKPDFQNCFYVYANADNGATATVNTSGKHFQSVDNLTFSTTVPDGYTFQGWDDGNGIKGTANPWNYGKYTSQNGTTDLTLTAKFKANALDVSCGYGSDWKLTLGTDYKNWALPPYNVKVGGTTIDASNYTLSYEVVSGPITINGNTVTVNDGAATGDNVAQIRVTATPKAGTSYASYTAGTALLNVDIKPVSGVKITIDKREIRVGEAATIGVTRGTGFTNPVYRWTFGTNAGDFLHLPTLTDGAYVVHQAGGSSNPTFELVGKAPTTGNIDINLQFSSDNGATEYKGTYGNGITVKPITKPTVTQDGSNVVFTYEQDYGDVDAYLEYRVGSRDASAQQTGFGTSDGQYTATDIPAETTIYVKSVVRYKYPADAENYTYASSEEVTYTTKKALTSIDVNGTKREYFVYVPDGLTSSESSKVGVVISLHGANNDFDEGRIDFDNIADSEKGGSKKFVVVYPRGLNHSEIWSGARSWESFDEASSNDTEFFKAIVNTINSEDNGLVVDYNRIYLAGFSNGGMMAYKAAHKDGDFYAACGSAGGFPVNESHLWHAGSRPVPFIHIHGTNDNVVRIKPSGEETVYDVNTIVHNMIYRNGASFSPAGDGDGIIDQVKDADNHDIITKDCHNALKGGAAYYYYEIAGMWHTASKDWTGDDKDDIAPAMWKFFNEKVTEKSDTVSTLKFRTYDKDNFWTFAKTGTVGFTASEYTENVLSYGGATKTNDNKNVYHSLQFDGGVNGVAHYLKLNVHTDDVGGAENEVDADYFLVKLTKTGSSVPVFAKRYKAGRGTKDLFINFSALPGLNEYKFEVTKSRANLTVQIHGVEFHTGKCQDIDKDENPVFFFDVNKMLDDVKMKAIYQPIYGESYHGIAKEYLPIADINATDGTIVGDFSVENGGEKVTSIPSTVIEATDWDGDNKATISSSTLFNLAHSGKSGESVTHKSNNAYIYIPDGGTISYPVDKVKGINISANGRAEMPEYLNGTRGDFPDRGVIAIKVQGTLDFYLLASSKYTTDANRRTLKVYYTNDQMSNEVKELTEWWFYGTRCEDYSANYGSLPPLNVSVRLPQLGQDGTCTLFVTYEGDGTLRNGNTFTHNDSDNDAIWIKGFVIKRPDLKVTIGRTDRKYAGQKYEVSQYDKQDNTFLTHFGENKPYVWNFENVGFNNTKKENLNGKKYNMMDGRTYVCGNNTDSEGKLTDMDHLLLYSNAASTNAEEKVQFDGRVAGQEHIEFLRASQYNIPEATNNRRIWDPIQSNGLKVNVTGSGWFKIKCSAPNGPVNMKVYSSTNYGTQYINLLREFKVDTKDMENAETNWQECTVYLKGHVSKDGDNGFWDGTPDAPAKKAVQDGYNPEEILRMSLFVVFDEMQPTADYEEGHPQLNIHELSWLNEEPADYVFQREENPELLTTWQEIKRDGKTMLWWKAANEDDTNYPVLKEDTYNVTGQFNTKLKDNSDNNIGIKSPNGYASTSVPSEVGPYEAYWDIAAPAARKAHTEAAYARGSKPTDETNNENQYQKTADNTEFDIPVSGSFIRICAMQNTYVVAHVLPDVADGNVYVLDETGSPIGFDSSSDDAKRRGYIAAMSNVKGNEVDRQSTEGTVRIDLAVNAGKEYFICANGASLSLARLEVLEDEYKPAKSATTLELTDGKNNSTAISEAYNTGEYYRDAKLNRKFSEGNLAWRSIVLPFSMNEKKFQEVFGKDARCLHFTNVDKVNNTVHLTHHYYNMIVAGRPVFVKPSSDGEVFKNTDYTDITDITLQAKDVRNTTNDGFTFVASYDNATMNANDLYLTGSNTIKYLTQNSTNNGMRSYIKNNCGYIFESGTTTPVPAKAMFLSFADYEDEDPGISTEIEGLLSEEFGENVVVVTKSTKVYDLNGRVVTEGAGINSLPAGIYIVNGKKFVVK